MTNPLEQRDISVTSNPADLINSYHVTILDKDSGERIKTYTHNYSIEECALHTIENLIDGYELIEIVQPDTNTKLTNEEILEL